MHKAPRLFISCFLVIPLFFAGLAGCENETSMMAPDARPIDPAKPDVNRPDESGDFATPPELDAAVPAVDGAAPDTAIGSPDAGDATSDLASDGAEVLPSDGGAPDTRPSATPPSGDPTKGVKVPVIDWGPCTQPGLDDCAQVKLPLDYAKPDGEQIALVVARTRATDPRQRIGSLFLNPGGPGASGVDFLAAISDQLSPELRARFDLVSWDPRGVPSSPAIDCKAMPTRPAIDRSYDHSPTTPHKDKLKEVYRTWVAQCTANSPLLPYVGTDATVSDLELLRAAVGDAKLSYLGFSYGTSIGQHYLFRYPEKVRAMVLDGVVDVLLASESSQDDGFELALNGFFDWCARATARDCPFARATPMRAAAYDALLASLREKPQAVDNGKLLTYGAALTGVVGHLYTQYDWPALGAALEQARLGRGTALYQAAVQFMGDDGPDADPFVAISCGDFEPITEAHVEAWAKESKGRFASPWGALGCVGWPVAKLTRDAKVPATLPPVVLIGSTGDAATPYAWATAAAKAITGSILLTSMSFNHTAYLFGEPCIDRPIDTYLLTGTLPARGITCKSADPHAEDRGDAPTTFAPIQRLRPRPQPLRAAISHGRPLVRH